MDFSLTDEQEMIVATVKAFVERELLPYEDEVETTGEVRPDLVEQIRRLMFEIPHKIRIVCDEPRALAGHLAGHASVDGVQIDADQLWVTTREPRELFAMLPGLARDTGTLVREMGSDEESLDAVFEYLVGDGV